MAISYPGFWGMKDYRVKFQLLPGDAASIHYMDNSQQKVVSTHLISWIKEKVEQSYFLSKEMM